MKKVRDVYQKIREVKYRYLVKVYKKYLKRIPDNCKYNYPYVLKKDKISTMVSLCFLHQPESNRPKGRLIWPPPNPNNTKIHPHLLDICQENHHCTNCNAFVLRYTKKEIQKLFEEKLKEKKFKEKEYPDLCALEWVLERSILEVLPLGWLHRFLFLIKPKSQK